MAHEFGHFSQRSMKLGSYVYVVNRVIYNLVYERDRWDALLDKWAASGGLWGVFASLTHLLVNLVRKILAKAYEWLNLRYMGLSREMEYQADLVAVSAAGGESIITALRRIELGEVAYQQMISHLNGLISESKWTKNVYSLHAETMQMLALENGITTANGLAILDDEQALKMASTNRVNYQDQWSSHPSQAEREANARSVSAICIPEESSPWSLFTNPEHWQKELTARLYDGVEIAEPADRQFINQTEYKNYVTEQTQRDQLPERYNGFYDRRLWFVFDPVAVSQQTNTVPDEQLIFSDENRKLRKKLFTDYDDRTTLEQIKAKQIQARSFDFEGKKYDRKDADAVLEILNSEINVLKEHFQKAEEDAFRWHYKKATLRGLENEFVQWVQLYFRIDADREMHTVLFSEYSELIQATHGAVKNGDKLPKGLAKEIDAFSDKMQLAYQNSESIQLPDDLDENEFSGGYAAYLCADKPQTIQSEPFDWEQMVTLYKQLEAMYHRAAHVQITVLTQLIRWQASL